MSDHDDEQEEQAFREKVAEANRHALQLQGKYLNLKDLATEAKKSWEFAVTRLQAIIEKETREMPLFDRPAEEPRPEVSRPGPEPQPEPAKKPRKRKEA